MDKDGRSTRRSLSRFSESVDYDPQRHARVLVLYTGGTIGMKRREGAYCPEPNFLCKHLSQYPHFNDPEYAAVIFRNQSDETSFHFVLPELKESNKRIVYVVKEYDPLLDSSNMTVDEWRRIALDIRAVYADFDGFVILHGTDTMAYTASALSFMMENLGKTVILTGSQIPIFETRSDGRENFIGAVMLAGLYVIPEVCIYFDSKLLRGNRCTKFDNNALDAFLSPSLPPLATLDVATRVDWDAVFRQRGYHKFSVFEKLDNKVAVLEMFPNITAETVAAVLCASSVHGVVLKTFGAGNISTRNPELLNVLKEACDRGVIIINCSLCMKGMVAAHYATGQVLVDMGIVPGFDMTTEAALTKLSYVLAHDEWKLEEKKRMLMTNLRGEMQVIAPRQFKLRESDLMEMLSEALHLSSRQEVERLRRGILPSLTCLYAHVGDVEMLDYLANSHRANYAMWDYDMRTPLHVGAADGQVGVVDFLISQGASVFQRDRWGCNPLESAVYTDAHGSIEQLRRAGATLGLNPVRIASEMCLAAAAGDAKRIESWLLAGADPSWPDYADSTPLEIAQRKKQRHIIDLITAHMENAAADTELSTDLPSAPRRSSSRTGGEIGLVDAEQRQHHDSTTTSNAVRRLISEEAADRVDNEKK